MGNGRTDYKDIPIVDAARRCGIVIDERTLGRTHVEASCPFCGDKPNKHHLSLNTQKDVFICFLCGERGNSVSLYARLQSPPISYGAAASELLAGGNVYPMPQASHSMTPPEREPKPIEARHEVFTVMLEHLALSEKHLQNLMDRGLSRERIERNMYRSLPESRQARTFLAQMLSSFYELDGIPGFFRNNRDAWSIAGAPGLLVPFRDTQGRIQGLQIRLDNESNQKRKYRWLASTDMKDGVKSGSWIHITGNTASKVAYVTEGGLKGDVASFFDDDALFICVAGINAINGLKEVIKSLGIRDAVIAADMDKVTNWRVRNGFNNISKVVSSVRGVKVRDINWNASTIGIDDYYHARQIARERGISIAVNKNSISTFLHELWKKEYPKQDAGFIDACEWEEKTLPLSSLVIDWPKERMDMQKAGLYLEKVKSGAELPAVVCLNGIVIDGVHRCWAYKQAGAENVRIYQNVPWGLGLAA